MDPYLPNPDLTIDVIPVGQAREPLLVIDDFTRDPRALVAAARASSGWRDLPPEGYPGRRASLPAEYARGVLRRLDGPIRNRLVDPALRIARFDCTFSMVTRPAEALTALQRIPHIDVANPNRVAILHYLCGPEFGGTAFFRQDATGFEQVRPEDRAAYIAARTDGLSQLGPEAAYPNAETPGYTRTGFVAARFDRLILYRSFNLHSGIVETPEMLGPDPVTGRLTATFFVDYAAPQG